MAQSKLVNCTILILFTWLSLVVGPAYGQLSPEALAARQTIIDSAEPDHRARVADRVTAHRANWQALDLGQTLHRLFQDHYRAEARAHKVYYTGIPRALLDGNGQPYVNTEIDVVVVEDPIGRYFRLRPASCGPFHRACFLDDDLRPLSPHSSRYEKHTHFKYESVDGSGAITARVPSYSVDELARLRPSGQVAWLRERDWDDFDDANQEKLLKFAAFCTEPDVLVVLIHLAGRSADYRWNRRLKNWIFAWDPEPNRWRMELLPKAVRALEVLAREAPPPDQLSLCRESLNPRRRLRRGA